MRQALKFKDLLRVFPYSLIFYFIIDMFLTVLGLRQRSLVMAAENPADAVS